MISLTISLNVTNAGIIDVTAYQYNDANQITRSRVNQGAWNEDYTYDANGNLTHDGTNAYAWDRANRLLSMGGASYKYDGLGNRVEQTVNSIVTKYLLDTQPGLAVVLESAIGSDVTRFVHGPRGLHAQQQPNGDWVFPVQDGLGSVRGVVDESLNVLESRLYAPYGVPFGVEGTQQTVYGFTGEPTDANELVYLRARYFNPGLGVFTTLDPAESYIRRVMSLNGYGYTEGNPVNNADLSGMAPLPSSWDPCMSNSTQHIEGCGEAPANELNITKHEMMLLAVNAKYEFNFSSYLVWWYQTSIWLSRLKYHRDQGNDWIKVGHELAAFNKNITFTQAITEYTLSADASTGSRAWAYTLFNTWYSKWRSVSIDDPAQLGQVEQEIRNPSEDFIEYIWNNTSLNPQEACPAVHSAVATWRSDSFFADLYFFDHWDVAAARERCCRLIMEHGQKPEFRLLGYKSQGHMIIAGDRIHGQQVVKGSEVASSPASDACNQVDYSNNVGYPGAASVCKQSFWKYSGGAGL